MQQRFQKDAIWRQMQEYKRDKVSLEAKLKETSKATAYHNDHLRIIDAWYSQVSSRHHMRLLDPISNPSRS
jgi:E3 ubiquitin-protein ligase BRE1